MHVAGKRKRFICNHTNSNAILDSKLRNEISATGILLC